MVTRIEELEAEVARLRESCDDAWTYANLYAQDKEDWKAQALNCPWCAENKELVSRLEESLEALRLQVRLRGLRD